MCTVQLYLFGATNACAGSQRLVSLTYLLNYSVQTVCALLFCATTYINSSNLLCE